MRGYYRHSPNCAVVSAVEHPILIEVAHGGIVMRRFSDIERGSEKYCRTLTEVPVTKENLKLAAYFSHNLFVFAPDKNEAYIYDANLGFYKMTVPVTFSCEKGACTSLSVVGNFALLVSPVCIHVVRLNVLLQQHFDDDTPQAIKRPRLDQEASADASSDNDVISDDRDQSAAGVSIVARRVKTPALDEGKRLVSTCAYGPLLCFTEAPIADGLLVLHTTDFKKFVNLGDDEDADWTKHCIRLEKSVVDHVCSGSSSEVTVRLIGTTVIPNPAVA